MLIKLSKTIIPFDQTNSLCFLLQSDTQYSGTSRSHSNANVLEYKAVSICYKPKTEQQRKAAVKFHIVH